jgi:hypothetical protein
VTLNLDKIVFENDFSVKFFLRFHERTKVLFPTLKNLLQINNFENSISDDLIVNLEHFLEKVYFLSLFDSGNLDKSLSDQFSKLYTKNKNIFIDSLTNCLEAV